MAVDIERRFAEAEAALTAVVRSMPNADSLTFVFVHVTSKAAHRETLHRGGIDVGGGFVLRVEARATLSDELEATRALAESPPPPEKLVRDGARALGSSYSRRQLKVWVSVLEAMASLPVDRPSCVISIADEHRGVALTVMP